VTSRFKQRRVLRHSLKFVGFVPKMFLEQTGDAKIDAIKEKMKYALMYDEVPLLTEVLSEAKTAATADYSLEKEINFV
jgi:hypothetical protein